jgi:hypothetical protein
LSRLARESVDSRLLRAEDFVANLRMPLEYRTARIIVWSNTLNL